MNKEHNMITKRITRIIIFASGVLFIPHWSFAQQNKGLTSFPDLVISKISGAPKLGAPVLITTNTNSEPIISQGFGIAAPAFRDWDGDGLKDLLIGEFGSGIEFGHYMGNFIRIYQNIGTETHPEFDGNFNYARPPFRFPGNGTPYSVDQSCCIGFTPQFVDLNADGFEDMVTGQYQGEVSWFRRVDGATRGGDKAFLPGETLKQHGNPRDTVLKDFVRNQSYWLYSSASFGDFTGDGKPDLIVGGRSLRISRNIGTPSEPKFAQRELLLDVTGKALKVYDQSQDELLAAKDTSPSNFKDPYIGGDSKISPYVVDWDEDGILDLLVTSSYSHNGMAVVDFFRGVKSGSEHRFEPRVPLFISKNGEKAFPGSAPRVFVTDWNNDGINDLIIGVSVVMVRDNFSDQLSWNWEKDLGLVGPGKDPGNSLSQLPAEDLRKYFERTVLPPGLDVDSYLTIRHQGYVYVMLGGKGQNEGVKKTKMGR